MIEMIGAVRNCWASTWSRSRGEFPAGDNLCMLQKYVTVATTRIISRYEIGLDRPAPCAISRAGRGGGRGISSLVHRTPPGSSRSRRDAARPRGHEFRAVRLADPFGEG